MEKTGNTYEELVQLKESGEIGWREFIRSERGHGRSLYDAHRGTRSGIVAVLKTKKPRKRIHYGR